MATKTKKRNSQLDTESPQRLPLMKRNFIMMGIAGAAIVIGFMLMLGGSSTPEEFNPDIFSTRRIVVGPAIAFLGYLFMAAAIIWRPRHNDDNLR